MKKIAVHLCYSCIYYEEIEDYYSEYYLESCSHTEGLKICDEVRLGEKECDHYKES